MHVIVIEPAGGERQAEIYVARLGEQVIATSRAPLLDGARKLLELGFAPSDRIVMRHAGSNTNCLAATIGVAAKLSVAETPFGPRFVEWVDTRMIFAA
jgi:hypothetical protein